MNALKISIITLLLMCQSLAFSKEKGVAKVIQVKGKAYNLDTKKRIKKNEWIKEGATLLTKKRSFVKLLFIDKSKMSLGPGSKMQISKFPKKDAGIISLMKGQLRSKVTKNYLEMDKKDKSKLFIKTKTAAMGVRGTDFQVNYNPVNENTSLITFEGRVVMNALNPRVARLRETLKQAVLESIVSEPTAVAVTQGQYSGVLPSVNSKPLAPVIINKKQLKILEANDGSKESNVSNDKKPKGKKVAKRSVLPPGVKGADFAGASKKEIVNQVAQVDKNMAREVANNLKIKKERGPASQNESEISSNNKSGLTPGGFVDTNNGLYIPPPPSAAIDPITNEVIMPEMMGNFDSTTGEYKNEFYDVNPDGSFVEKSSNISPDGSTIQTREPASLNDNNTVSDSTQNPDMNVMDMMKEDMMLNDMTDVEVTMEADPNMYNYNPDGGIIMEGDPNLDPDSGTMTMDDMEKYADRATQDAIDGAEDNFDTRIDQDLRRDFAGQKTRLKINVRVEQ